MSTRTHISRRTFLQGAIAAVAASATRRARAEERPNILFLLTDDQRADSMGCAGNPIIHTPEMDRLAADGTRFTNAFVTTPICCASRPSILTGQYSASHGIEQFNIPFTPEQLANTYPSVLQADGYYTGFVGKWGIGGDLPRDGFDDFRGYAGQGVYFPDKEDPSVHLTAVHGDQAIDIIQKRDKSKPFCLSVSFKSPHVEDRDPRQFLYDPKLESLYADDTIPPPPKNAPEDFESMPSFLKESEGRVRWHRRFETPELYQQMVKGYYRLVSGVDVQIGRLRALLEEEGIANNTIIIFSSDHGFFLGERGLAGKWLMDEESIRVPFIIYDPRRAAWEGGRALSPMVLNIDIAPTILALAGSAIPNDMDGENILPLLDNPAQGRRESWFFEHHFGAKRKPIIPQSEGVRTERWSYVRYLDSDPLYEELYDIQADPGQLRNLVSDPAHANDLAMMRSKWSEYVETLKPIRQ